ncbi:hypothetical protein L2D01_10260 [Hyphomonadaceae bacterium ML37]|nr:hypothetical protein L2D01_10260 [Hyphomonadaceae bacterium ML37]
MARYYVNKRAQATGEHEVHRDGCSYLPAPENRVYLGDFPDCHHAIEKARSMFGKSDGCYHCSYACHAA